MRRSQKATGAAAALEAAVHAVENQLTAARVSQFIDRPLYGYRLPPPISQFLDTHWRTYLLKTYLGHGGSNSRRWQEAIKTMKELIWSVRPNEDMAPQRRLFTLLPQLYERLHSGLESVGVDKAEQDKFFAELAKLHQAALRPDKSNNDPPPRSGA